MKLEVIYNGDDDRMIVRNADTGEEVEGVLNVEFEWDRQRSDWYKKSGRVKITCSGMSVRFLNPPTLDVAIDLPRKRRADGSIS